MRGCKPQHGVAKPLQGEEALREAVFKGVATTVCSVITDTKTCIKQLWQTTTEKTGPLENRVPLAFELVLGVEPYLPQYLVDPAVVMHCHTLILHTSPQSSGMPLKGTA